MFGCGCFVKTDCELIYCEKGLGKPVRHNHGGFKGQEDRRGTDLSFLL